MITESILNLIIRFCQVNVMGGTGYSQDVIQTHYECQSVMAKCILNKHNGFVNDKLIECLAERKFKTGSNIFK